MQGKLSGLAYGRDGKQLITLQLQGDFSQAYDQLIGKQLIIDIKQYRPRRSLDANAYFHVLCDAIARRIGASLTDVKTRLVLDYGAIMRQDGMPVCLMLPASVDAATVCAGSGYPKLYKQGTAGNTSVNYYLLFKSTHLLNSLQMARLIDGTIAQAKQLGIQTMTPRDLARLKGYYTKGAIL